MYLLKPPEYPRVRPVPSPHPQHCFLLLLHPLPSPPPPTALLLFIQRGGGGIVSVFTAGSPPFFYLYLSHLPLLSLSPHQRDPPLIRPSERPMLPKPLSGVYSIPHGRTASKRRRAVCMRTKPPPPLPGLLPFKNIFQFISSSFKMFGLSSSVHRSSSYFVQSSVQKLSSVHIEYPVLSY